MQEPLENLSAHAQQVHAYLADGERSETLREIAAGTGKSEGPTADALRELEAAQRVTNAMGGDGSSGTWAIVG